MHSPSLQEEEEKGEASLHTAGNNTQPTHSWVAYTYSTVGYKEGLHYLVLVAEMREVTQD